VDHRTRHFDGINQPTNQEKKKKVLRKIISRCRLQRADKKVLGKNISRYCLRRAAKNK